MCRIESVETTVVIPNLLPWEEYKVRVRNYRSIRLINFYYQAIPVLHGYMEYYCRLIRADVFIKLYIPMKGFRNQRIKMNAYQ
jgi:hypothetical protein